MKTTVFVQELTLSALVGVHPHERRVPQPVIFTVEAHTEILDAHRDELCDVICYDQLVERIQTVLARGHVQLLETLAQKIARELFKDKRIYALRIRASKPEAISAARAAGVEIFLKRA